jgi:cell volume regulation protein A
MRVLNNPAELPPMYELFFVIGLAIFIGFLATVLFERTRISQVLILMAFGFLLGPLFHVVDVSPDSVIVSLLPFLATLVLIVLLFDAGLMIDVFAVARAVPKSTLFTLLAFSLTVLLVAGFSVIAMHWPLLHGVLLGAVVGGTSSAIVITMIERLRIGNETRSLLTLESTLTDALCILTAVLVIQLISANQVPDAQTVIHLLLSEFTVAILLGLVSAAAWLFVIERYALERYAYMLTLALVFSLFAVTETLKANGGFAVFVFGMVLGNSKELGKLIRLRGEVKVSPNIRLFQEEITFFVRTFFFVYIGLLLSPGYFSPYVLAVSAALLGIFLVSRWLVQKLMLGGMPKNDRNVVVAMMPRGLAAAVLATMPLSSGIIIPNFQQLAFVAILFSNIAATLGVFVFDREGKEDGKQKPEEELEEVMEAAGPHEEGEAGVPQKEGEAQEAEGTEEKALPAPKKKKA